MPGTLNVRMESSALTQQSGLHMQPAEPYLIGVCRTIRM